jgi:hypothetical protein
MDRGQLAGRAQLGQNFALLQVLLARTPRYQVAQIELEIVDRPGATLQLLWRENGLERDFRAVAGSHLPVPIGAEAIVRTGGGWGNPLERDPARVWEDVAEGLVSAAAARKLYGVVHRRDRSLDERATNELRERLRSAQAASTKRSARPKAASKKPDEDTLARKRGR